MSLENEATTEAARLISRVAEAFGTENVQGVDPIPVHVDGLLGILYGEFAFRAFGEWILGVSDVGDEAYLIPPDGRLIKTTRDELREIGHVTFGDELLDYLPPAETGHWN